LLEAKQKALGESIGKQAPPLSFQDIKDSSSHELTEYRGKVILLNFWSSNCDLCTTELSDISYLQDEYKKAGLKVIFLGPPDYDTQQRFFKIHKISGLKVLIAGNIFTYSFLYCGPGIPTFILINRDGVIKDAWMGPPFGYDAIEKRINALIPRETNIFKSYNPRLVLISSIVLFCICLIVIGIIWNKKREKVTHPIA
jgi:peroxiredoxin